MKDEIMGFLKKLWKSLNPLAYKELCQYSLGSAFWFFLLVMLLGFFGYFFLNIPLLVALPGEADAALSTFRTLEININADSTDASQLFGGWAVMDSNDTLGQVPDNAGLYVNSTDIIYQTKILGVFGLKRSLSLSSIKDILAHKKAIPAFLATSLFFAMPGLMLAGYLFFTLKALAIIMLILLLVMILVQVVGFSIKIRDMLCISFYASVFLAIQLILKPIVFTFFIPVLIFFGYVVAGTILTGDFEEPKQKKKSQSSTRVKDFDTY